MFFNNEDSIKYIWEKLNLVANMQFASVIILTTGKNPMNSDWIDTFIIPQVYTPACFSIDNSFDRNTIFV